MAENSEQAGLHLAKVRQKISGGDFSAALGDLEDILRQSPQNIEALYMLCVAQRYTGDFKSALANLDQLKTLSPAYSRAHQEEGHIRRALKQWDAALSAYTRALQLNPALEASLRAQLDILTEQGRERSAIRVQAQLEALLKLPQPLRTAKELAAQNKLLQAEEVCRAFLQQNPRNVDGMRELAEIGSRLGVLEDAEFLLESAVAFEPDSIPARMDYVQILRKRQKFAAALEQAQTLLKTNPQNPQFRSLCAIEYMQTGQFDTAISYLDEVLRQVPFDAVTLTTKGHALKTCGRSAEAVEAYRTAVQHNSEHGEAYYSLANLKTYRFTDDELKLMHQQAQNSNLGFMDRIYLHFALGKAYEDQQAYESAFEHYAHGNQLKKAQSRYDAERMCEEINETIKVCSRELFSRHQGHGHPAPDPIFILGLPRAGSTLLEQVLSSHSQIDGTLELPNILSLS